jgi:carbonic anhydrase/acetyltransferase-like protein (isoleucine patch superfamily)
MLQSFDGHDPALHPSAWVHEGAWVIGEVELGEGASVWPGAVLRGDMGAIRIGRHSNVQDNCVVHDTHPGPPTVVGERCTIGHRAVLHSCHIEDDCLVGMGAIVLDGARIQRGSIVGAGALVTGGKTFPPGSLILGSPARAVRPVTAKDTEWIAYSYGVYVDKAAKWRQLG